MINIYPFLLAIYPVLFVYSQNINYFKATVLIPFVLTSTIVIACILLTSKIILKNSQKAAFFSALFVIYIYSFEPIENLFGISFKKTLSLIFFILLTFVSFYLIFRSKQAFTPINRILAFTTILLITFPSYSIIHQIIKSKSIDIDTLISEKVESTTQKKSNALPDVFYVILDEYSRHDTLKEVFGYDNTWFIENLEQKGFFIPKSACSNYPDTCISMAAALNFSYVDDITSKYVGLGLTTDKGRVHYHNAIYNNRLFPILREAGYKVIMFDCRHPVTHFSKNTDTIIKLKQHREYTPSLFNYDFLSTLLGRTPIAIFQFNQILKLKNTDADAQRTDYTFQTLLSLMIESNEEPRFVYAHIVCPHEPYVFDREGKLPKASKLRDKDTPISSSEHKELYVDQTHALNNKVLTLLDEALSSLDPNTIIIIQSDHGLRPGVSKKFIPPHTALRNFNAYFGPKQFTQHLYPSISPVNTFRIFLTQYLGYNLPLLPDRHFNKNSTDIYDLVEVEVKML